MKIVIGGFLRLFVVVALLMHGSAALAQWELDGSRSAVNFISIKNGAVAEIHSFASLVGYIGRDGQAQLSINLDSVETLIEVRNERMREMLFKTVQFPAATVSASVAPDLLAAVVAGGAANTDLALDLNLHGMEKSMSVPVVLVADAGGDLQVFTAQPVIINAADFGLAGGISALQAVAGLDAISTAVPVTVHLVFTRAE